MTAAIEISLLGPWQMAGGPAKAPRRKEQGLLAYLAVEADQPHSRDSLIGLFWPDLATADARNNLRVTLSRLKPYLDDGRLLEITRHTVRFTPNQAFRLDVAEFLSLIKKTENHHHTSLTECQPCQIHLKQAVDLYRGEFLAGFFLEDCLAFEEWLFVWRERLHVQMLKQLERLAQAAESSGHFARVEQYARRQLELDSLREPAHRQLMRALMGQGQRSAALNHYQSCVAILREELGVEPDIETQQLVQTIEAETFTLTPGQHQTTNQLYVLPENTTPFIGREAELAQLAQRLNEQQYRLISLVGPGGIGKTRLAIEAARSQREVFQDGIVFIPLEGVQRATEIPAAIAEAMGITFNGTEAPQTQMINILRDKQLLLVIDNLEHIIEDGVELLLEIVKTAPQVVLLMTSRERLNVQLEDLFLLQGLPHPTIADDPEATCYAAVRLFADRAHRIDKTFSLNEATLNDTIRICQLVEGLPLGLELAATWIQDFSVFQIATSLENGLDVLETDLRDISPRHRNIAAVFEHSWARLSETEQTVLAQVSVFRGGFTFAAAQQVTGTSPLVLTRLRYKSLIRGGGDGRYTMHELLRQLAERKLKETLSRFESTQKLHSQYFLTLLQQQGLRLKGKDAAEASTTLRLEIDNIRRAWQWAVAVGDFALIAESVTGLVAFYEQMGLLFEGAKHLQTALNSLELQTSLAGDIKALLLVKQLALLWSRGKLDVVNQLITQTQTAINNAPYLRLLEAEAYFYRSQFLLEQMADIEGAWRYFDKALPLAEQLDNPELLAWLYCHAGRMTYYAGRFDPAIMQLEKALQLFEQLAHVQGQAMVYSRLAPAYAEQYKIWQALQADRRALALYEQLGNQTRVGDLHTNVGASYILVGAYQPARYHTLKALDIFYQQGDEQIIPYVFVQNAEISDALDENEAAEQDYQHGIAGLKETQHINSLRWKLIPWGRFLLKMGRYDEAYLALTESVALNQKADTPHFTLTAQAVLACVVLAQGNQTEALALITDVWREIEPSRGLGYPFPLDTLFDCYIVFQACNVPQTTTALTLAESLLKQTAIEIDDPEMRASFLNNVPVNQKIQQALRAS
jgi:DNA-binding SARP family transcriptional activator/predicted ATPase